MPGRSVYFGDCSGWIRCVELAMAVYRTVVCCAVVTRIGGSAVRMPLLLIVCLGFGLPARAESPRVTVSQTTLGRTN